MQGREKKLPLFEIARMLVRFDHVARFIINPNHGLIERRCVCVRNSCTGWKNFIKDFRPLLVSTASASNCIRPL
jgi:hypothetical protein